MKPRIYTYYPHELPTMWAARRALYLTHSPAYTLWYRMICLANNEVIGDWFPDNHIQFNGKFYNIT